MHVQGASIVSMKNTFFFLIISASTLVEHIITTNYKKLPPLGNRNRLPTDAAAPKKVSS